MTFNKLLLLILFLTLVSLLRCVWYYKKYKEDPSDKNIYDTVKSDGFLPMIILTIGFILITIWSIVSKKAEQVLIFFAIVQIVSLVIGIRVMCTARKIGVTKLKEERR